MRRLYWEAQHARVKAQLEELKQGNLLKEAKIKDLRNRLFGKRARRTARCNRKSTAKRTPTRWEVFVDLPGKVGTRWYLWVTRSRCMGLTGCPLRAVTAAQGRAETASATGS
jgi:hypothetical protein